MTRYRGRTPLAFSEIQKAESTAKSAVDPTGRIQVTVILTPAHGVESKAKALARAADARIPGGHDLPSHEEFEALHDPGDEAIARVVAFAREHTLDVVATSRARHDVVLEGPVGAINAAFGVELRHYDAAKGRHRAHDGPIHLPPELAEVVEGVLGLDTVPVQRSFAAAGRAPNRRLSARDVAEHYRFPSAIDAREARIALLEFGGGYHESDIAAFARRLGIRVPTINTHSVTSSDGSVNNNPLPAAALREMVASWNAGVSFATLARDKNFGPFMSSLEVTMDVQIAMAMTSGATIDVFFAPIGLDGWRRAVYAAIGLPYDGKPAAAPRTAPPAALSISWGESESVFQTRGLRLIDMALVAARRRGTTVCCASGDNGSSNVPGICGKMANANFPASSPAVLACGGSALTVDGAKIVDEKAWKETLLGSPVASGGGMSGFFAKPDYQETLTERAPKGTWLDESTGTGFVGRWLPDVSACAAFETPIEMVIGGEQFGAAGTSAATPIWASLVTLASVVRGKPIGWLNPWLYGPGGVGCRDLTVGDNDVCTGKIPFYSAGPGWDPCTGFGSPDGRAFIELLSKAAPSP